MVPNTKNPLVAGAVGVLNEPEPDLSIYTCDHSTASGRHAWPRSIAQGRRHLWLPRSRSASILFESVGIPNLLVGRVSQGNPPRCSIAEFRKGSIFNRVREAPGASFGTRI